MIKYIAFTTFILNVASVGWSAYDVFKKKEISRDLRFRIVQFSTSLFFLLGTYFFLRSELELINYLFISFVQIMCTIGFWTHVKIVKENEFSAVFSTDVPPAIVQKGLYQFVRNPFYLIYLMIYWSLSVGLAQPILMVLALFMTGLYINAAKFEEKKFLSSPLKEQYLAYLKQTGRFIPKFRNKSRFDS